MKLRFILNNLVFPVVSIIYLQCSVCVLWQIKWFLTLFANIFKASLWLCKVFDHAPQLELSTCSRCWNKHQQTDEAEPKNVWHATSSRPPAQRLFDAAQQHAPVLANTSFFQSQLKVSCNINVSVVLEMTSIPNALSACESHCVLLLFKCWISCQIYGCSILKS